MYNSTLLCENQRAYKLQFYITFFHFLEKKYKHCRKGEKGTKLEDSEPRQDRDNDVV